MAGLSAYLWEAGEAPFEWGQHDCVKFVCGWLVASGYDDPSDEFGLYDEAAANDILAHHGSVCGLAEYGLAFLPVTETPKRGDIGCVRPFGIDTQIMAIFTGKRWAFKTQRGILCASAEIVKVWSVG